MRKNERELTLAEKKRKADFEKVCEEMEQRGYLKKDMTFDILQANVLAVIIMLPFVLVVSGIYFLINPIGSFDLSFSFRGYIVFLLALIFLTVLHEVIHGLTWGFFAQGHLHAINFGVIWKALTPYCTCTEPLTKWQYVVGVVMPTLIVGFVPAVIAVVIGNSWLMALSAVMILAGGGDFLILWKILLFKSQNKEILYYDHPYECGFVVFEKV